MEIFWIIVIIFSPLLFVCALVVPLLIVIPFIHFYEYIVYRPFGKDAIKDLGNLFYDCYIPWFKRQINKAIISPLTKRKHKSKVTKSLS